MHEQEKQTPRRTTQTGFRRAALLLMAGNSVLLKPACNVPGCVLMLEQLFQDALRIANESRVGLGGYGRGLSRLGIQGFINGKTVWIK